MDVYVYVDEYVFNNLEVELTWAIEDEDEDSITRLTALLNRLKELDDTTIEMDSLEKFGKLIAEFKNQGLKVNINYNSRSKEFRLDVEFA